MGEVKPIKTDNWPTTEMSSLFTDGERVLCFHGPLIYEAKVLKTNPDIKPVSYYIHYAGWSKNWDEWVPESRVLKYNDENVKRQKELSRLYGERSKKDNKKGSAKAKKHDLIGNESRASTPSKDGNVSVVTNTTNSGTPATTKSESGNSSSTTTSSVAPSRGNRKPTQAATICPGTPNSNNDKKDDTATTDTTEDEAGAPVAPKKNRMSSHTSEQRLSIAGNGSEPSPPTAQPPSAAAAATTPTTEAPCVESEESYATKLEVKIKIPDELKHYLTDDWYAVAREHKLLELPAKVTVQQIVEQYLAHKKLAKSTNANKEVAINDVLDGIVEYFNVMLGSQLLYKFERTQYADIMQKHPDTPLSELYGSFHLLRLFVKLGAMLSYSALDQQGMQTLLAHLHDFLKFLAKNSAVYFSMGNFINVDPEYMRNAQ